MVVNRALAGSGVAFSEVTSEGGFPVFKFETVGKSAGPPKTLIFASPFKPDLRFSDVLSNEVEILSDPDLVIVYDRPFERHGLRWRDLQQWWAERHGLPDEEAKGKLYTRLRSALPRSSPPQALLFETFFRTFKQRVLELPALLPEVWLHWDPKTVSERGFDALIHSRMDFLMLLPNEVRVVIEVDGKQHYADGAGKADPKKYAAMVRADRELRIRGYDLYRFGAAELQGEGGDECVADFFTRLFARYGLASLLTDKE